MIPAPGKGRRWIRRAGLATAALLLLVLAGIPLLGSSDGFRAEVQRRASRALGREVRVEGTALSPWGLGLTLDLKPVEAQSGLSREDEILFSESPTRFLLEVPPEKSEAFQRLMGEIPCLRIGQFQDKPIFQVLGLQGKAVVETDLQALHGAWTQPFQGW